MVGEIKMNVKAVIAIIDAHNAAYNLLKEVLSKSISEKINEVRKEEQKKAEEAINQLALEHQAAINRAAQDL